MMERGLWCSKHQKLKGWQTKQANVTARLEGEGITVHSDAV